MSKNRFGRDVIPYTETIDRLNGAFSPLMKGTLIPHEKLRGVIQPASDSRYRGVLEFWKRQVKKQGLFLSGLGRARGLGLMVCSEEEKSDLGIEGLRQSKKKFKRCAATLNSVETTELTAEKRDYHNLWNLYSVRMAAQMDKDFRQIRPPSPPRPDNVRPYRPEA